MAVHEGRRRSAMTPVLLVLLLVQFLLAMWLNLWVPGADDPSGVSPDYFAGVARGTPWALTHGPRLLALRVALMSIAVPVRAIRLHDGLLWPIAGATGLPGATGSGASFLNDGHDVGSFLMFAVAVLAYAMLLGPES